VAAWKGDVDVEGVIWEYIDTYCRDEEGEGEVRHCISLCLGILHGMGYMLV